MYGEGFIIFSIYIGHTSNVWRYALYMARRSILCRAHIIMEMLCIYRTHMYMKQQFVHYDAKGPWSSLYTKYSILTYFVIF